MSKTMHAWFGILFLLLSGWVGTAHGSPATAASASYTQTANSSTTVRFAGPNTILEAVNVGTLSGDLSGSTVDSIRVVIHADGSFTAHGTTICECQVAGKEGILELTVVDRGEPTGPTSGVFAGSAAISGVAGELSGLHGVFDVAGTVDLVSGLSTLTLTGQIHFDP